MILKPNIFTVAVLAGLAVHWPAIAQVGASTLTGRVVDATAAAIPNVHA